MARRRDGRAAVLLLPLLQVLLLTAPGATPSPAPPSCAAALGWLSLETAPGPRYVTGPDVEIGFVARFDPGHAWYGSCGPNDVELAVTLRGADGRTMDTTRHTEEMAPEWRPILRFEGVPPGPAAVHAVLSSAGHAAATLDETMVVDRAPRVVVRHVEASAGDRLDVTITNEGDWAAHAPGPAGPEDNRTRLRWRVSASTPRGGGTTLDGWLPPESALDALAPGASAVVPLALPGGPRAGPWTFTVWTEHVDGPAGGATTRSTTAELAGPDASARVVRFETRDAAGAAVPCPAGGCPAGRPVRAVVAIDAEGIGPPAPDVRLEFDGGEWERAATPGPGEWTSAWRDDVTPGRHAVAAEVDPSDALVETDETDNVARAILAVPDLDGPELLHVSVDRDRVREGAPVLIETLVRDDGPIAAVDAAPRGLPTVPFQRVDGEAGDERWQALWRPTGALGAVPLTVRATDSAGHVSTYGLATVVEVVPWPVAFSAVEVHVNDEDGAAAPWRGTFRAPLNAVRISGTLSGHGWPVFTRDLVEAWLEAPGGARQGPFGVALSGPGGASPQRDAVEEGLVATADADAGADGQAVRFAFDSVANDAAISAPGAWRLVLRVRDVAGRWQEPGVPFSVLDPDGPPRVGGLAVSTRRAAPGDPVVVSVDVTEALRVADVAVEARHAAGPTIVPLVPVDVDATTGSGRYAAWLVAGGPGLPWAGTAALVVRASDVAGGITALSAGGVHVADADPPRLALDPWPDQSEAGAGLHVGGTVKDATRLAVLEAWLDAPGRPGRSVPIVADGRGRFDADVAPEPDATGAWRVRVRAVDGAGNTALAEEWTTLVEQAAPRITPAARGTRAPDGAWWVGPAPAVAFDVRDPAGVPADGVRVVADGVPVPTEVVTSSGGARVIARLTELRAHGAEAVLEVTASDALGARSTDQFRVRVDARAPRMAWSADPAVERAGTWRVGPATGITILVEDDGSGAGPVVIGARAVEPAAAFLLRPVDASAGTLRSEAWDQAGNRASLDVPVAWDADGPEVAPLPPPPGRSASTVRARAHDAAGVVSVVAEWSDGRRSGRLDLASDGDAWAGGLPTDVLGETAVAFGARDGLGNEAWTLPVRVRPEAQPPTIRASADWTDGRLVVRWDATDADTELPRLKAAVVVELTDGRWVSPDGATDLPATGAMTLDPAAFDAAIGAVRVLVTDGETYGAASADVGPVPDADVPLLPAVTALALTAIGAVAVGSGLARRR